MAMTAQIAGKTAILASIVTAAVLINPVIVEAAVGSPQTCNPSSTCTVGEFLYDDEYIPITSGTCTITSRYPDGSLHLNSQNMTAGSDGWYSYEFTAPAITGYYRSQICCTSGSDYMCLDKSFEVKEEATSLSTSDIATAVWGYSSRSMTGFGNLVSDVWASSSRSLSSFGTLAQDVWNHNPRTLTDATSPSDVSSIKKTVEANRLLLEQLVNKPIIQNFLEEDRPDLTSQVEESNTIASQLFLNSQTVVSELGVVLLRWDQLKGDEINQKLGEFLLAVGKEGDGVAANSVLGQAAWFKQKWNWKQAGEVYDQAAALQKNLAQAREMMSSQGDRWDVFFQVKKGLVMAETLEKLVGMSEDTIVNRTLYGKLAEAAQKAKIWDEQKTGVDKLLASGKQSGFGGLSSEVEQLGKEVAKTNIVPKGLVALESRKPQSDPEKRQMNKLLAIRGLVDSNRVFLAKGGVGSFVNTWLEVGSMVFKSMVTNPSTLISQKVQVKYYLPPEVKKEDVIETDSGLSVKYDVEKNQSYVEGELTLSPGESQVVSVRTTDIWDLSDEEIATLRKQAEELAKPLERTAFFAQGVTLTSDINVSLDKAKSLYDAAKTPEQKIRSFREAMLEIEGVKVKIDKLKDLVGQVSSSRSLLGFVGGAQALAVWGMVIILLAGFVFLALYMRMISVNTKKVMAVPEKEAEKKPDGSDRPVRPTVRRHTNLRWMATVLITGSLSAVISSFVVRQMMLAVVQLPQTQPVAVVQPTPAVMGEQSFEGTGGPEWVKVAVGEVGFVNVRSGPGKSYAVEFKQKETVDATVLDRTDEWVKVSLEQGEEGWVAQEFVVEQVE